MKTMLVLFPIDGKKVMKYSLDEIKKHD